jgi:hypothetical protein
MSPQKLDSRFEARMNFIFSGRMCDDDLTLAIEEEPEAVSEANKQNVYAADVWKSPVRLKVTGQMRYLTRIGIISLLTSSQSKPGGPPRSRGYRIPTFRAPVDQSRIGN